MQFPKIGETFICNNGTEFTCCNVNDLTPSQTATARDYAQRGVLGDIIGKAKNGGWMHWNSSIEGGDESFNWKIKQINRQFNPKFGDTIVTAARGNYVCVPKGAYYGRADFYGKQEDGGWSCWMHDGNTWTSRVNNNTFPDIDAAYRVVEIIPAKQAQSPVQAQESTLEFRIRVLEKENQMLTRLLLKEGKL